MTDICLLVYLLPHVSLCGFIRYLIKYKFATNNDSGDSQKLIYFYHRNSPGNESKRCRKQCVTRVTDEKHGYPLTRRL